MVVLIALDGESYDDCIQKRGIIEHDVATTKIVSYVKLELIGSSKHRSAINQDLFCAAIGVRRSLCDLLASLSQRK